MKDLRDLVNDVVERKACSGCGLCVRLDLGLEMTLDDDGYLRPMPVGDAAPVAHAAETFREACPGVRVRPNSESGAIRHPLLGSYVEAWQAWATDPEIRRRGSSGGALTALHVWMLQSGRATRIAGAAADSSNPRRSVPVTITTRADALAAAGSRYAPVAALTNPDIGKPGTAVTAKPCEISALRAASGSDAAPLLLSFFCAGTPSQKATDRLLSDLGIAADVPVETLRYRGDGWPGRFTAQAAGKTVDADYEESWGATLGPTTQWRCKVCVDGVGESSDVVAADFWETDERGYPVFAEGDGVSALLARTRRGAEAVAAAVAAGVIEVRPLDMNRLASAQPLQTSRRRFLAARIWGARLAGRRSPLYRGFGLLRLGLEQPRTFIRTLRGARGRVRRDRSR